MPIPPWLALVLREAPHLAKEYGPAALAWARQHPELVRDLVAQVRARPRQDGERTGATASAPTEPPTTAGGVDDGGALDVGATIATLREHVAYLLESADDDAERRRAEAWATKLDRLERAHALVGPGGSAAERRQLEAHVERLRAEVVAAFLVERIEDAGGPSPSDADH